MLIDLYNTILYQPIFNLLVWFYNTIPGQDVGLAIIAITLVIKIILYPLSLQSIKSQKALQGLQPKMDELRKKYKDKQQELARATMELYKKEKISPFSSCLPILIQLPFFIAVYQVFRKGLSNGQSLEILYPFVSNPGVINTITFGILDLSKPSWILALLAGITQYWVSKMLVAKKQPQVAGSRDESMTAVMNKQMTFFMPLITVFIGLSLPGGLTLYWFVTTLLTGIQQVLMFRSRKTEAVVRGKTIKALKHQDIK